MYIGKEQDYEGMSDAKSLHEAHAIRRDKKRHKNALGHLKHMSKTSSHSKATHEFETKNATGSLSNAEGSPAEEQNESASEERAEGD